MTPHLEPHENTKNEIKNEIKDEVKNESVRTEVKGELQKEHRDHPRNTIQTSLSRSPAFFARIGRRMMHNSTPEQPFFQTVRRFIQNNNKHLIRSLSLVWDSQCTQP